MKENPEVSVKISSAEDVIRARQAVRELAREMGFGAVDQTRLTTAVSELARNIYQYATSGIVTLFALKEDHKAIKVVCEDWGPGIPDIELAMSNGFSTRGSLGLGLPGSKRLVDDFEITSEPGKGTRVTITKWL